MSKTQQGGFTSWFRAQWSQWKNTPTPQWTLEQSPQRTDNESTAETCWIPHVSLQGSLILYPDVANKDFLLAAQKYKSGSFSTLKIHVHIDEVEIICSVVAVLDCGSMSVSQVFQFLLVEQILVPLILMSLLSFFYEVLWGNSDTVPRVNVASL